MTYQLRSYTIKEGEMEEWISEWSELVYPLRRRFGFEVVGAWVNHEDRRFVWIIGHDDFEARDRDYYASAERKSLAPDPARHLEATETVLMSRVVV